MSRRRKTDTPPPADEDAAKTGTPQDPPPASPPDEAELEWPTEGGSYIRDPATGALTPNPDGAPSFSEADGAWQTQITLNALPNAAAGNDEIKITTK